MLFIKRLLMTVCSLMIILALAGFVLPQKQHVERSTDISATAEEIYPYLASPKLFGEWSPWSKIDPNMKVQYTGPAMGKGAGMAWQSEEQSVGSGTWQIVDAVENKSLSVEMDFNEQGTASSFFRLDPKDSKTQVTWGFDTDAGMNPLMRWVGLLMDKMVGSEYEKGLAELKVLMEK